MYTQQEVKENEKFYHDYQDQRILFSSQVSKTLGLKQQKTIVKINSNATKGALVSATMTDLVLIANIDDSLQKKLYLSNDLITVQLSFYDSLFKKQMTFTLFTKFQNMNNHGLNRDDMQYLCLQLKRKIPNELISVFGKYHEKVKKTSQSLKPRVAGMIFCRGIKKQCSPLRIDEESILISQTDNPGAYLNRKCMIVLKSTETNEVFEIIGKVANEYTNLNNSYQIKLNYSVDQQSPRFIQSFNNLSLIMNHQL